MNIQEYSKKILIFLILGMRSIILQGQKKDDWAFQRPQKVHGIQSRYITSTLYDMYLLYFLQNSLANYFKADPKENQERSHSNEPQEDDDFDDWDPEVWGQYDVV